MDRRFWLVILATACATPLFACSDVIESSPCDDPDGDGVCVGADICAAGDDAIDTDGDGVPDACDECAGQDDLMDADGDGVPDGCDVCAAGSDAIDSDGDGVADACDVCPDGDDALDGDGDGLADACDACPADNPNDANGDSVCDSLAAFEVAYIAEFTFGVNTVAIGSTGLIINTGLREIDLSTAQVVQTTDDHPTVDVTVNLSSPSGTLPPGQRAGSLSPLATTFILDSGLVTEPASSGTAWNLGMQISAGIEADVGVTTVIEVDGSLITLEQLFHFSAGASTSFDETERIQSEPSF